MFRMSFFSFSLCSLIAVAAPAHHTLTHPFSQAPMPTHVAVANADGPWHVASTWQGGLVPGDGASVLIPATAQVRITRQEAARIEYLEVAGELRMVVANDTRLRVETLYIAENATFRIGTSANPVHAGKTAEIVFLHDGGAIDAGWDAKQRGRGLVSDGTVRIYGQPKTHMAEMDLSAVAGQSAIDLRLPVPADWQPGDEIVLAGTHFKRGTPSQDERLTITGINGQVISIDPPLAHTHARASTEHNLHVAHLTRNVILRSESADIPLRGHVMLRSGDVDIRHAALIDLGRTDKAIPLDELVLNAMTQVFEPNPNPQNRRGRYALHFHLNHALPGQEPPSKVYGVVVIGTPGWAFVNHSSYVDFRENVAYGFVGAGFVTESGDELGNFFDNLAIRGTGNGEYRPARLVFGNGERPQLLSDFAFSGDGFWFQGPAVRARDNVANGCNGAGMIWFTTGAVDIATDRYVGFPRDAVAAVYAGFPDLANLEARNWQYDPDALVTSDLPILECDGFDGYANLVGFRLRFNNFDNNAFYGEVGTSYVDEIATLPGRTSSKEADRIRQRVSRLALWNNETGFRVRYNSGTDWSDVTVLNELSYHPRLSYLGAELAFQTESNTFDDLLIRGYGVAALLKAMSNGSPVDNTAEITFTNTTYQAFANPDTRQPPTCDEVVNPAASSVSSSSATLSWDAHAAADRFLVRYRPSHSAKWAFRGVVGTASSVTLTALSPATEYRFQILAGCPMNVSLWSWEDGFMTSAAP